MYREATEAYGAAITLLDATTGGGDEARADLLAACLSNRAAAWLRRKRWQEALADSNRVLRLGCAVTLVCALQRADSALYGRRRANNVMLKALFRRGKAHEGLGDAESALADFKRVVELEPNNAAARDEARYMHMLRCCAGARLMLLCAPQVENYNSILHRLVVMSYCDADTRRRQHGGV